MNKQKKSSVVYIVIQNGITYKTCYTSITALLRVIKGPHPDTIYNYLRKSGIYSKNGLVIERLVIEKLPIRNKNCSKNIKIKENLRTIGFGSSTTNSIDYSSGVDPEDRNTYKDV